MHTLFRSVAILSLVAILYLVNPVCPVLGEAPAEKEPPAKKVPKQAAHAPLLRFKILDVTKVQQDENAKYDLLELKVQRWYGKVDQRSWDLYKKHETQEITFLYPAALDAKIKVGDIIDYRIDRYIETSK